ncbi:MarR family transcriptional regulator [Paenibacillus sp.]|uniref:MarR family winged helix-turn-helix transcriptional regulator n=1 Tax=Paenibacillus sp. TaxID=58172 RepID=UPI002D7063B5|nr:MarR family transcriptional regulator [Paenibacillus sp.]HZG56961.1 MarR family transcriptional regulator [Paenibacillus sp.]
MRTEEEEALRLLVILYRAYRAVEAHAERSISKSGLNPTEFAVLELLYHKGSMPLQHIGEKILIASGSITYVLDKLEKKELAVRIQSREDRRITYADLTARGRRFMDDFFPQHGADIRKAMEALTTEEMSALAEGLKKLGRHARDALS